MSQVYKNQTGQRIDTMPKETEQCSTSETVILLQIRCTGMVPACSALRHFSSVASEYVAWWNSSLKKISTTSYKPLLNRMNYFVRPWIIQRGKTEWLEDRIRFECVYGAFFPKNKDGYNNRKNNFRKTRVGTLGGKGLWTHVHQKCNYGERTHRLCLCVEMFIVSIPESLLFEDADHGMDFWLMRSPRSEPHWSILQGGNTVPTLFIIESNSSRHLASV